MKRLNILSILLVACISSFFFVNKVDALFKDVDSKTNTFTITDKGNYVVIHKLMDLNGEYTIIDSPNDEGEELLGTEVILPVRSYTGFKQPEEQTITIHKVSDEEVQEKIAKAEEWIELYDVEEIPKEEVKKSTKKK